MKRVILTKYGFTRFPEEDFHDDGNNFTCYRFSNNGGRNHVSKLVADGQAYLSCHVDGNLPHEVYSNLPHYKRATWDFNGVSVASLTDALLQDFFNSCVEYEREYHEAESQVAWPSIQELVEKCEQVVARKKEELKELTTLVSKYVVAAASMFSDYEWKRIKECIVNLEKEIQRFDPMVYPNQIYRTATSIRFLELDYGKDNYWSKSIKEVFNKYGLSSI